MHVLIHQKLVTNDNIIITVTKNKIKKIKEKPICGLIATFSRKLRALGKIVKVFCLPSLINFYCPNSSLEYIIFIFHKRYLIHKYGMKVG